MSCKLVVKIPLSCTSKIGTQGDFPHSFSLGCISCPCNSGELAFGRRLPNLSGQMYHVNYWFRALSVFLAKYRQSWSHRIDWLHNHSACSQSFLSFPSSRMLQRLLSKYFFFKYNCCNLTENKLVYKKYSSIILLVFPIVLDISYQILAPLGPWFELISNH